MKKCLLISLCLILMICMAACENPADVPEQSSQEQTTSQETQGTTQEITTQEVTTEEVTTEEITTEEITTEEETTQAPVAQGPTREEVKNAAVSFVDADEMIAASANEMQDWSDFGGLTKNEDGSVTALIREDSVAVWDPYFYLIKQDTVAADIMVIQYRSAMEYGLKLFLGTNGNAATGSGDLMTGTLYETGEEWGYLIINIGQMASAYDSNAASLGYLRFGLDYVESGETVDIGYIAFFHSMEDVNAIIPQ